MDLCRFLTFFQKFLYILQILSNFCIIFEFCIIFLYFWLLCTNTFQRNRFLAVVIWQPCSLRIFVTRFLCELFISSNLGTIVSGFPPFYPLILNIFSFSPPLESSWVIGTTMPGITSKLLFTYGFLFIFRSSRKWTNARKFIREWEFVRHPGLVPFFFTELCFKSFF